MATAYHQTECFLDLPDGWVTALRFENAFLRCGNALGSAFTTVVIRIPARCKLMIQVVIRLLSFCNQMITSMRRVRLEFAGGADGVMGYLNRMGFFDHLANEVEIVPGRPHFSGAARHRGANQGLVEIEPFSRLVPADQALPGRLADAVERGCAGREDSKSVSSAVFGIFSELIGNVFAHSQTNLDAYAALQTYPQGNRVTVAVSDSGFGLVETLRPTLVRRASPLADKGAAVIVEHMFREGISRLDDDNRGLGLAACARSAIRFGANLEVRLLNQLVELRPANGAYQPHTAYALDMLPLLWGTHISFSFDLS